MEMNSEPETKKIETKFVAQISLENETWELFYPFVHTGGKGNAASTPGICGRKLV